MFKMTNPESIIIAKCVINPEYSCCSEICDDNIDQIVSSSNYYTDNSGYRKADQ